MNTANILVVEDDSEIADLLEFNLEQKGYEVRRAETGLSACQAIGVRKPDLILLDIMLPDFDGWEICSMIRGHGATEIAKLPIIMLTAMASPAERVKGLRLGADDYVCKPFSVEELILRIEKQLSSPRDGGAERDDAADRNLLDFQDMVFHELCNQLLIVCGYSDRLLRHSDILPQEKVRSYAQAIYASGNHLGSLAEEMLLLRRLKEQKLQVSQDEIDLSALSGSLREVVAPKAHLKGISLNFEIPEGFPKLRLNLPSLKIVLSSLMDNAIKYGRPGGRVVFTAAVLPDGSAALYVEDDGLGIPEEESEKVFEQFARGSNVADSTKGTGLGLYFVKTLTEAMGGSVAITSTPGVTTRFRLVFPLTPQ